MSGLLDSVGMFDLAAALPEQVPTAAADPDLTLWRAIVLAAAGRGPDARRLGEELLRTAPDFAEVARRFVPAGLVDAELLAAVLPVADPTGAGAGPAVGTVLHSEGE